MRFPLFFNFGSSTRVIQLIDTHDGERKRRRWEQERRAKEELRSQIRAALEYAAGERLAPALEEISQPGPEPIAERVDLDALVADIELSRAVRAASAARGQAAVRDLGVAREARRLAALALDDEDIALLLLL